MIRIGARGSGQFREATGEEATAWGPFVPSMEIHPATLARVRHGGGPQRAAGVARLNPGTPLRFWAMEVAEKRVETEKGDSMQFVSFEDETALCEAVVFPDAFQRRKRPFLVGDVVPVAGHSWRQDGLAALEVT